MLNFKNINAISLIMVGLIGSLPLNIAYAATYTDDTAYLPIDVINNSRIAKDDNVYISAKATNSTNNHDCFLKFDLETGYGVCDEVNSSTDTTTYAYKLSSLPNSNGKYRIFVPKVISGRIYISVGQPMDFYVDNRTMKITEPDGFKPRDSNYYTLYDKFEFSYTDDGTWINPTAVDFFSLPIHLSQSGSTSGITQAGFSAARSEILKNALTTLSDNDKTSNKIWSKLLLTYLDENGQSPILRLVSPGKAMIPGVPDTQPFDQNYLNNTKEYAFSYIDNLWSYYKTHKLIIDCSEIKSKFALDNYQFTGQVIDDKFVFTNQTHSYTESIDKPKHSTPFFAGSSEEFNAPNNTPKAIIIRQLTSAFDVGLLPAPDNTLLNKNYFETNKNKYYQTNLLLPATKQGPWYDLYSKALHSIGNGSQPIYTFAYDDALGQDGTLHDGNGSQPSTVQVTLGDMTGSKIPNPYTDDTVYSITTIIGKDSVVVYKGKALQSNQTVNGVTIPFEVTLNGKNAKIYIKHPMVRPYFDGADGIVIDNQAGTNAATIIFPGK